MQSAVLRWCHERSTRDALIKGVVLKGHFTALRQTFVPLPALVSDHLVTDGAIKVTGPTKIFNSREGVFNPL